MVELHWGMCSIEQAETLTRLGVSNAEFTSYTLSEIAVLLGYTYCQSNVKEAADRLIDQLKSGLIKVADANARLKEAVNA